MPAASLPMYDFPDVRRATDAWWDGLRRHLAREGLDDAPAALLRRDDLIDQWRDPGLVVSQACGYILTRELSGHAQPVAAPRYDAPGCEGTSYASVILARADHPGAAPADFAGGVAVYSRSNSHAGYNAFRALIAPLADGRPFFSRVIASGSHLDSIAALASGQGDLATIDAIIHAFVARWRPQSLVGTRILGFTPPAPAPPYIAPASAPADRVARLRAALHASAEDPGLSAAREALFLKGFEVLPEAAYRTYAEREAAAAATGYPALA